MAVGHKTLTLEEKIRVIEEQEKNQRPVKELAALFQVGKSQIYCILKNKINIKELWMKGTAGHARRISKCTNEVNRATFQWFVDACAKGIPVSGPLLQAEALEMAKKLGRRDFKASNGWLESFKKRHNIVFSAVPDGAFEILRSGYALCEREFLQSNPEDAVDSGHKPHTTGDAKSAVDDAAENGSSEAVEEIDNQDKSGEPTKIRTFGEALSATNDLQEFAASKNVPDLVEVMQSAKDIIQRSFMKKSRHGTMKEIVGKRN